MADFQEETIGRDLNPSDMFHQGLDESIDDAASYEPDGQKTLEGNAYEEIMDHYEATGEVGPLQNAEEMSDEDAMADMPEVSE